MDYVLIRAKDNELSTKKIELVNVLEILELGALYGIALTSDQIISLNNKAKDIAKDMKDLAQDIKALVG